MATMFEEYSKKVIAVATNMRWEKVQELSEVLLEAWKRRRQVFLCGNGGSAANAIHLANDYLYGIGSDTVLGMRVEGLPSNQSVLTCLGNDVGYENIYSEQLKVKAECDDVLIVFSGSGNSPNIVNAIELGNKIGMKTCAIVGYSGGKCRELAKLVVHIEIDDMQIAEDFQLIIGHMCMQWLRQQIIS